MQVRTLPLILALLAATVAFVPNASSIVLETPIAVCEGHADAEMSARTLMALPGVAVGHDPLNVCPGIRPGGALVIRAGPLDFSFCTMAFIVTDGADLYVATAGHCTDPAQGLGPRFAAHGVPGDFGTIAYRWCEGAAANGGCGAGTDFALIKVDENKRQYVSPAMCKFGAPTGGMFTSFDSTLRSIQHFGWGMVIGDATANLATIGNPATQAREGLGLSFTNPNYVLAESAAISGDSGSGVLVMPFDPLGRTLLEPAAAPQALGVLTHISAGGLAFIQRLDTSLEKAGVEMGKTFTVVSAL